MPRQGRRRQPAPNVPDGGDQERSELRACRREPAGNAGEGRRCGREEDERRERDEAVGIISAFVVDEEEEVAGGRLSTAAAR